MASSFLSRAPRESTRPTDLNVSTPAGTLSRWLLAPLLLGAGVAHFLQPGFFTPIVPPLIPWPLGAVLASGAAELVLGLGLLIPRTSRISALGAAALLLAVSPANVYHWVGHVEVGGRAAPGWYHLIRLPLQAALVAWAWWLSRRARPTSAPR